MLLKRQRPFRELPERKAPLCTRKQSQWDDSVAPAYFFAWRNVHNISLAEVLRDDTMM